MNKTEGPYLKTAKNLLFPEKIEKKLYQLFKDLQKSHGCTYMFFSYEHLPSKIKFIFQSDPEWNTVYIENDFIKNCPIINHGAKIVTSNPNQDIILQWNLMLPENNREKSVINARKDHGIFHGLSIVKDEGDIRRMFGIATDEINKKFTRNLLSNNKGLQNSLSILRKHCDAVVSSYLKKHLK